MNAENQAKLRKIRRASIAGRVICDVLLAMIALIGAGTVFTTASGIGGIDLGPVILRTSGMDVGHRAVLAAIAALAWGILFKCFYHLRRLFQDFARGDIFTRHAVSQFRWFGIACMLWGFTNFAWMVSMAASSHVMRKFPANADSVVTGIVIIAIAWFMDMAVDLREENELTI